MQPPPRHSAGIVLGIIQFVFALTWTVYVVFLPRLAAESGIPKRWVVFILLADQVLFTYTLVGKTLAFQFEVVNTSVGGAANTNLQTSIPAGRFNATSQFGTYHFVDNGTHGIGLWAAATNASGLLQLLFYKTDFTTNWMASVNATDIRASGLLQVSPLMSS